MNSAQYPRISKISGSRRHISKSYRKEFWVHSHIFTVVLLVIFSLFIHGVIPARASSYQPHSSIHINGNDGFNSDNGVTRGTGTPSDPYIIQGWDIVPCCKTPGISITNTSAYFVIRNMNVHSTDYPTYGINLTNVSNGAVEDSQVTVYWWSLTVDSSKNILVSDDTVSWITINSSQGITVSGSGGTYGFGSIASSDNVTLVNDRFGEFGDFQISDSTRVTAENNTFTSGVLIKGISPEQFDTNKITPDNVVDGRPLLFYKDCSGLNVDSVEVGELIVANCEGVRISNLTFNNICCIVETAFVSDAIVANITSNRMVLVANSSSVEISHVRVENGINIESTSGVQMSNNVGHIDVSDSVNVSISNNNGDLGRFTATISSSSDVTISGNTFSPICDCTGLVVDNSSHVNLSGNTFTGDEGVDVTNSGFIEISDNQFPGTVLGAIILDSCSMVSLERNQILPYGDEYHGVVRVSNCDSVNISGNTITAPSSSHGTFDLLRVSLASNITISGNNLSNSTTAVGVSDTSNVTIVGNNIQSNIQGVVLNDTENVLVFHNNFLNNTVQAIDTYLTQNAWDNGYPSGGNFWSDYTGVDNCSGPNQDNCSSSDGIGDTPYAFNNNQDNYPLINRFILDPPHSPILIDGDAAFTPSNGVTGGIGTSSSPYIIEGWRIDASTANGIEIRNVSPSVYFVIQNVFINSASDSHAAIVLENLGGDGSGFESSNNIFNGVVANATLSDDAHGVVLSAVSNVKVESVKVRDGGTGIECTGFSEFNIVSGNDVRDTTSGVVLDRCLYMDIFYNSLLNDQFGLSETPAGNDNGIDVEHNTVQSPRGFTISNSMNNIIANNQIRWDGGTGGTLFRYGVNVTLSTGISVTGNSITNAGPTDFRNGPAGVVVSNCPRDTVTNVPGCDIGIVGNTISVGDAYGVALLSGAYGRAQDGQKIKVYHNNFLNNSIQAFDDNPGQGLNLWDNGYPSGGNFWSDYTGVDNCSGPAQDICPNPDGIGDTPYLFNYNQDNYPLTKPY